MEEMEQTQDSRLGWDEEAAFQASLASDVDVSSPGAVRPAAGPAPQAPPGGSSVGEHVVLPPGDSAPADAGPGQPVWLGKMLGHFRLIRLVGQGAMGLVVKATDVHLRREVALKVLRKQVKGMAETQRVGQFFREARAVAKLDHPNVIRIYEIGQHQGWWYIAMEMLEGEDLKKVVQSAGPLPAWRACLLLADAAAALAVAHQAGIIHRDVKPSNLMVTPQGRCKLTDFGFAKVQDPEDPFDFTDKSVGTPQFMAPEIIRRQPPTTAVDVYSLGATLYYALTGAAPFVGPSVAEICDKHLTAPPPDATQRSMTCSKNLARLIQQAMAKDPAARPTALDLAIALRNESLACRTGESGELTGEGSTILADPVDVGGASPAPSPATPATTRRRGARRRYVLGLICALSAGLILAGAWQAFRETAGTARPHLWPRHSLAQCYPDAPATYGLLAAGAVPQGDSPAPGPPGFGWVGKVDPGEARFVASRQGRHYWPVDAPAATRIRAEDFVGYRTADQARADGKAPAP